MEAEGGEKGETAAASEAWTTSWALRALAFEELLATAAASEKRGHDFSLVFFFLKPVFGQFSSSSAPLTFDNT